MPVFLLVLHQLPGSFPLCQNDARAAPVDVPLHEGERRFSEGLVWNREKAAKGKGMLKLSTTSPIFVWARETSRTMFTSMPAYKAQIH